MCVQRKKPEVSIVYLRGDISILVPAVFSEIVAILTAPAVHLGYAARICRMTCSVNMLLEHASRDLQQEHAALR
jgi:hypothetical protein